MSTSYLGVLDYADPLYEILFSQVYSDIKDPLFHVDLMSSRNVYKYTEEKSRTSVIGKFFQLYDRRQDRIIRIKGEYDNLQKIRGYGFDKLPYYVVRPISKYEKIGLALIEEFIQGRNLDYYFRKAIYHGAEDVLNKRLSELAYFLFLLHGRTVDGNTVDLDSVSRYFQKVVRKLHKQTVFSDKDLDDYLKLMDKWLKLPLLQDAKNVIVHGDATPTNFIFTDNNEVVAIDLERMKNSDPAFDISMVCGEIKHAFLWLTGDLFRSEPFIRRFLKGYSSHFDNPGKVFRDITSRNPFYMALTELRIARNNYLDWNYRKRLAYEAKECLKWGLKL